MKQFHILTLFPEIINDYCKSALLGRAIESQVFCVTTHQLRDYSSDKHKTVDDRPYGGGSGMVLRADVMVRAVRAIKTTHAIDRVIAMSPRGNLLGQNTAKRLSCYDSLLLVSGRYEGIDQRALDLVVDEELSIGDYVLSGGELAALVCLDVMARLIPDVIGNPSATCEESFETGLLEYPHYTRPEVFENLAVPKILLSGHHEDIKKWRETQAREITKQRRPDLSSVIPVDFKRV